MEGRTLGKDGRRSADDLADHACGERCDVGDDELLVCRWAGGWEGLANCFMPSAVMMLMMLVSWLKSKQRVWLSGKVEGISSSVVLAWVEPGGRL